MAAAQITRHQERRHSKGRRKAMYKRRYPTYFGHYFSRIPSPRRAILSSLLEQSPKSSYKPEPRPRKPCDLLNLQSLTWGCTRGWSFCKFATKKKWKIKIKMERNRERAPISLLADPPPNLFGMGRMPSLLKGSYSKKPTPWPSGAPIPTTPTTDTSYNQKLENALAVECLVRQITEWDTQYTE